MDLLLHLSELSPEPLHAQISRQIRAQILAREIGPDDGLPSIRALARDSRVSVITVQRAYEDLEREGLLRSRPGKGFYVAQIAEERTQQLAEQRLEDGLVPPVDAGRAEGLSDAQIRAVFERVLRGKGETR